MAIIEPYPFQQQAIDRMLTQQSFGLFDEMGLGKTVVVCFYLKRKYAEIYGEGVQSNSLIICPKSVISVWHEHIGLICPEIMPWVTVTNWDQLRLHPEWQTFKWFVIVADEAHYAKNRKAQRTKALFKLKAEHKIALTGTPIVNRPDELWSIIHWLYPPSFKSYWKFFENFVRYRIVQPFGYYEVLGSKNIPELQRTIRPFVMRRLKKDVLQDLPDKYYSKRYVELNKAQRTMYEDMKKDMLAWVGAQGNQPLPAPTVLAKLTRLRQIADATPALNNGSIELIEPSAKLDALMDIIESNGPVVVYSQFKRMIDLAVARLHKEQRACVVLTGDTPGGIREQVVNSFQHGDVDTFLSTLGAGSLGITLHRSSTAVFLDRSWSPAQNLQAEDRLHRIGQKNAVHIIHIEARNTVDQVVEVALQRKAQWVREVLGG